MTIEHKAWSSNVAFWNSRMHQIQLWCDVLSSKTGANLLDLVSDFNTAKSATEWSYSDGLKKASQTDFKVRKDQAQA